MSREQRHRATRVAFLLGFKLNHIWFTIVQTRLVADLTHTHPASITNSDEYESIGLYVFLVNFSRRKEEEEKTLSF